MNLINIEKYRKQFNIKVAKESTRYLRLISSLVDKYKKRINELEKDSKERTELLKKIKEIKLQYLKVPSVNSTKTSNNSLIRDTNTRYADDFIIGIIEMKKKHKK